MRARNLKPDFFKNEVLAGLPDKAKLLFIGLWCLADREGRLEDRPKRIEAEIFPYQKVDVEHLLNALSGTKDPFIVRYEIDGMHYIEIVKFAKHQHPHPNESPSRIPKFHTMVRSGFIPKSDTLGPLKDVMNPDVMNPYTLATPDFEKVWALYPRPKGKKQAQRHFKATVKTDVDLKRILAALENYKRCKEVRDGFVQNGSTWFNNWQDWENHKENVPSVTPLPPPPVYAEIPESERMTSEEMDAIKKKAMGGIKCLK